VPLVPVEHVADSEDLWALPTLLLPLLLGLRRAKRAQVRARS
jgi:hypothetical protein